MNTLRFSQPNPKMKSKKKKQENLKPITLLMVYTI